MLSGSFENWLRKAVSFAWDAFARKVGGGVIGVNKEASTELHYSNILNQILPLVALELDEHTEVELQRGVKVEGRPREVDLLVLGKKGLSEHRIAVEFKCYRTKAASGNPRGATDIFMKDVYADLHLLERYCEAGIADRGVALVMNDREGFINPRRRAAKCWDYDISEGKVVSPRTLTTQVGSTKAPVYIELKRTYRFAWQKHGGFWFAEMEGT